jgi:hypothetical protein
MLMGGVFEPQLQPSESMFSLRSALDYKYNPSVRTALSFTRIALPLLGELRVSFGAKTARWCWRCLQFFKLWTRIETAISARVECAMEMAGISGNCGLRTIVS